MILTGFTLELDGEPEVCRRLLDAVQRELSRLYRERDDDYHEFWSGGRIVAVKPPLSRFQGTLTVREEKP